MLKFKSSSFHVLQAEYGDCIFISIQKEEAEYNILIDGGVPITYFNPKNKRCKDGPLKQLVDELKYDKRCIDLLIVTHVDRDHVGGIEKWFSLDFPTSDFVREVWINDDFELKDYTDLNNTSAQAASVIKKLRSKGIAYKNCIVKGQVFENEYCKIRIIAPSPSYRNVVSYSIGKSLDNSSSPKELRSLLELNQSDWEQCSLSPENKASIAFELESWDGVSMLLLGDAEFEDYMSGLNYFHTDTEKILNYDCVKLSHHGSKNNFSPDFLQRIYSKYYIVSSNGKYYHHPDKIVLAKILCNSNSTLGFNYEDRVKELFSKRDYEDLPELSKRIVVI